MNINIPIDVQNLYNTLEGIDCSIIRVLLDPRNSSYLIFTCYDKNLTVFKCKLTSSLSLSTCYSFDINKTTIDQLKHIIYRLNYDISMNNLQFKIVDGKFQIHHQHYIFTIPECPKKYIRPNVNLCNNPRLCAFTLLTKPIYKSILLNLNKAVFLYITHNVKYSQIILHSEGVYGSMKITIDSVQNDDPSVLKNHTVKCLFTDLISISGGYDNIFHLYKNKIIVFNSYYTKYILDADYVYSLEYEWFDYHMILAIINHKFNGIYRLYNYCPSIIRDITL